MTRLMRTHELMRTHRWRVLAGLLAAAIAALYIAHYCRVAPGVTIAQAPLHALSFELLNARDPLIVQDRVADVDEFVRKVLAWQHLASVRITPAADMRRNRAKWLVAHAAAGQATVRVAHPQQPAGRQAYIDVVLRQGQLLMLPFGWWWSTADQSVKARAVNDAVSALVGAASVAMWK